MMEPIQQQVQTYQLIKATLSKPRNKGADLKNIYVQRIDQKGEPSYRVTLRYKTSDETKVVDATAMQAFFCSWLEIDFYNGDFFTESDHHSLLQSKKGKVKWLSKKLQSVPAVTTHNRKKSRPIPIDTPWLMGLDIVSSEGRVYQKAKDKYRQINRYVELVQHLLPADRPATMHIRDMGSGKGYLTFALHHALQQSGVKVCTEGIELRSDLVDRCNAVAAQHKLQGLQFVKGSIDSYPPSSCDMVIALHACDIATDMAIAHAINSTAQYIVLAPCCHKQVRKVMQPDAVAMTMLKYGIHMERQAEMLTDSIRALLLEASGYTTKVFEWISTEHTGKNVMITARYTGHRNHNAMAEIEELKKRYGIAYHYLGRLLEAGD